jgi:uncharacterized protein (TIGR02444 family)
MTIPTAESNPFWSFSLAVYESRGVAAECLALQDTLGIDVNVLLFCAYLGAVERAVLLPDQFDDIARVVKEWHGGVVRPLRTARQVLKTFREKNNDVNVDALLRSIKSAELESECIEQFFLWNWFSSKQLERSTQRDDALVKNLILLFHNYGSRDSSAPYLTQASLKFAHDAL